MSLQARALSAGHRGWADPAGLRSTTVELAPDAVVDPVALACGADGQGPGVVMASGDLVLAGSGTAARLDLEVATAGTGEVRRWLAAVAGGGAVAFGALPFSPWEPAALVVPSLLYRRRAGRQWLTVVAASPGAATLDNWPTVLEHRRAVAPHPPPRCTGVSGPPDARFTDGVRRILDAIADGRVTKVVLARHLVADYDAPLDVAGVLRRLQGLEPSATLYGVVHPEGAFVGASPELLVARHGCLVESRPLAGTVRLSGDAVHDDSAVARLASSPKETDEHGQVVAAIVDALAPLCRDTPTSDGPTVARLGSLAHLATRVRGVLAADTDALGLVGALHPTPAVAGTPTTAALELIEQLEPVGRGPYAGAFGWMDGRGDGEFVLAIRGAAISDRRAAVHAGAGIVAGSDPTRELVETTLKLRVALSALGAPLA